MTTRIKERESFTRNELVAYFDKKIKDMKEIKGYCWHDKQFFLQRFEEEKEEKLKAFDAGENIEVYEERYYEHVGNDTFEIIETMYSNGKVKTGVYGCN